MVQVSYSYICLRAETHQSSLFQLTFCRLAKEKGYRARAAFKLIQLNRKYGFLEKSKVLLDLCAAPGSWCQVAAETMPAISMIIGVDLAPIKPIPRTTTFQSDITTDVCRATIRQHLKTWKADTVLHDGAPNIGTAWVQDAFSQAELALQALKLATEFLLEGGTFVTKLFRSKDYNALLWVFNQLFLKVEATKPPSSRNVSAEIFVVCRGFKAPKRIDPKFLDPRFVFAEISGPTPNNEAKIFNPEKKKRKREGYQDGDYIQFKAAPASDFIQTTDPIAVLGNLNKLSFEQQGNGNIALAALEQLPETTNEIKKCCMDLKVLGRKEFRMMLRWRLKARRTFGFITKDQQNTESSSVEVTDLASIDDESWMQEELEKRRENESLRKKRERRRHNERKQKELIRMQMHMTTPTEIGLEQRGPNREGAIFALDAVNGTEPIEEAVKIKTDFPTQAHSASEDQSDEVEDSLDEELDVLYSQYQERKSIAESKYRAVKALKNNPEEDWEGFSKREDCSYEDFDQGQGSKASSVDGKDNHDSRALSGPSDSSFQSAAGLTKRAAVFFEQDLFKEITGFSEADHVGTILSDDGMDDSLNVPAEASIMSLKTSPKNSHGQEVDPQGCGPTRTSKFGREGKDDSGVDGDLDSGLSLDAAETGRSNWDTNGDPRRDGRLDIDIITAEAMTLAQQVASGEKSSHDLMDETFNKYSFRDTDGLPEWFLDDESKHSKPHRPISAAGAIAIKEKFRALNARPIKKVREAKDRKKFKAAQKLEKLLKKSALVADEEGISEKDKAQNIAKLMSKAAKKRPAQQVKLVVAKGSNRGISGRPRGVKGKYKIVDSRLKKDVRAEKRLFKQKR